MNRNFLLAALFFLLVLTGYNQFVVIPRMQKEQQAAEQQLEQAKQEAALSGETAVTPAAVSKTAAAALPEELITFDAPSAQITFSSKGAGIKTYLFRDVTGDLDLTPYKGEGYFATLPQLDFAESRRTKDSITFAAQPSAGVEILKTYRFNENGINNLSLTFNNKNEHEVALPAFDFNFGPGLSTTQSELSDNERESKAVYLTQEPGKKNPTLVEFTDSEDSPASGKDWIWAGVQNRYFLSVLIPQNWTAGTLATDKQVVTTRKRLWGLFGEGEVKGPQLQVNVLARELGAKSSLTLE